MKTTLLLIISCFLFSGYAVAQKLEIGVQLNTGISKFGGGAITSTSKLYHMPQLETTYTKNLYGDKAAVVYGVSGYAQKITAQNIVLGAQLGVESLKGRVKIDWVDVYENNTHSGGAADGTTTLRYDFLNFHPYLGRRFETGKFIHDLTLGTDIGLIINANEKTDVTYGQNNELMFNRELGVSASSFDIRPRFGITSYYQSLGFSISYAHGLVDYKPNLEGGVDQDAFIRVLRFGLTYKLK